MLANTFCHIRGIGPVTEQQLWSAGVSTWEAALQHERLALSPAKTAHFRRSVLESVAHLDKQDARFFFTRLPPHQQWRAFPEFRHSVAYLDIETTGLGGPCYIHGHNLDQFPADIAPFKLLVTYNGKGFDLPFIEHTLGIDMPHAHIDLRYVLASLGYKGGLKGCERQLGLNRRDLHDVDGFFAVLLWNDYYYSRNLRALETLLAYNILDVVNLETLMVIAYNTKLQGTPFADSHRLPLPTPPPNPFDAHRETIERLRPEPAGWYGAWRH
jgi:uncharacterized protein YprB with RNaseH-like and TPR domain